MEDKETVDTSSSLFQETIRHGLIFIGALSILMAKEYVSAKLLTGLVILDYFTFEYIKVSA